MVACPCCRWPRCLHPLWQHAAHLLQSGHPCRQTSDRALSLVSPCPSRDAPVQPGDLTPAQPTLSSGLYHIQGRTRTKELRALREGTKMTAPSALPWGGAGSASSRPPLLLSTCAVPFTALCSVWLSSAAAALLPRAPAKPRSSNDGGTTQLPSARQGKGVTAFPLSLHRETRLVTRRAGRRRSCP